MNPDEPLPITGERTTPGVPHENYWFQRHVVAYELAARLVAGGRVLDAGAGEGYGAAMLALTAHPVIGTDLEAGVAARAAVRYPQASFLTCDLQQPPWRAGAFDGVVSLQVIEHLPDPPGFLIACARAMKPGARLVLATPNRLTFSPDGVRNPFHTIEYSPEEFAQAVSARFDDVDILGVRHKRRIRTLERMVGPFPERILRDPPEAWPRWLRAFVRSVRASDFEISAEDLDASLDLIAVARAR